MIFAIFYNLIASFANLKDFEKRCDFYARVIQIEIVYLFWITFLDLRPSVYLQFQQRPPFYEENFLGLSWGRLLRFAKLVVFQIFLNEKIL